MRRHVHFQIGASNDESSLNAFCEPSSAISSTDLYQLNYMPRSGPKSRRFENTIEAKVEHGETLQSLSLRFNCSVADIKRLNKIDKDNEIYARKVVKIPVTVHTVLLGGILPAVHRSGNNSPSSDLEADVANNDALLKNPLDNASAVLSEKLMVASVNASASIVDKTANKGNNNIILNSSVLPNDTNFVDNANNDKHDVNAPLISEILYDETLPQPRPIRGPSLRAIDWSGSDCDMSWICLFIFILALCFVIPLVYVIYLAEHPHHNRTTR